MSNMVTCPGCKLLVRYDAPACQARPVRYGNACPLWEKGAGAALLAAEKAKPDDAKDAARYRWLRDKSVPPHNFYLAVPIEFKDDRYTPDQVDAAIDAAIGKQPT